MSRPKGQIPHIKLVLSKQTTFLFLWWLEQFSFTTSPSEELLNNQIYIELFFRWKVIINENPVKCKYKSFKCQKEMSELSFVILNVHFFFCNIKLQTLLKFSSLQYYDPFLSQEPSWLHCISKKKNACVVFVPEVTCTLGNC